MATSESWSAPDRVRRYRERVFGERERLRSAFADPAGRQRQVLAELLEFNKDTEFGRAHGFARITSLDDYRKAVPVHDYAALGPLIERMAAGERNVLSADDPALYFTSSGTIGAHKKIPVTPAFMRSTFFPFGGLPYGRPNPRRAAELERYAERYGELRPAHVWPRLKALFPTDPMPSADHCIPTPRKAMAPTTAGPRQPVGAASRPHLAGLSPPE
ncbi:GH3 auxin-responsive promoter family protein [Kitasatospora sp. NPDC052896]|uniref:GH3 family domain-containing protein n=1 Tax=Kitasatospora sp. NPDC052896 TaxID=3364061 RepID=UPI0037CAE767